MVKRTNDLYIVDEGPIIDTLEDSSQETIENIKKNYIYDKNKAIPRLIFYEEKNRIDLLIYKGLCAISLLTYLSTKALMICELNNVMNIILYLALVLSATLLTAGLLMIIIGCIFKSLIQQKIIPFIIKRKYR